ncbi:MAG: ABC transporter permease [Myxococcota bacterium]
MKALQKKLLRDLWRLRYQGLTIALLVGCGIASLVAAVAASASMEASRDAFYAESRFADVFASLKRAPRGFLSVLAELPGVAAVEGRIVGDFRVEPPGLNEPATARFISLAWPEASRLNQIQVKSGRSVEPGASDEIVLSEALSESWSLRPGDALTAVINGRRAKLRVVGTAVAPDYALALSPRTGLTDPRHFGVVWMDAGALAEATDLLGFFNDLSLELGAGADLKETLGRVDRLLEPYGGVGALGRSDQMSARLVEQKVSGLRRLSRTLPVIFLGIAVFLLNVLLSRIVGTQREQIATLKALGYRTRELFLHYIELALAICTMGVVLGIGLGLLGARGLLLVYAQYFKFPAYLFRMNAASILSASALALCAGLLGAYFAVRRAVQVPPAEAMRPEAPPSYRVSWTDLLLARFRPVARMVLRDVQRKPFRLLLSSSSIALATSIVVAGSVFNDSMLDVLRLQFEVSRREQISVSLDGARSWRAVREVAHVPGVLHAEGERMVPVRLRAGHLSKTTAILGLEEHMALHRLLGTDQRPLELPPSGLSLSRALAEELGARVGDQLTVELLEGDRRQLTLRVGALIDDLFGLSGYMGARELAKTLGEPVRANLVLAAVERSNIDAVTRRLEELPWVGAVSRPDLDRDLLHAEIADALSALSVMLAFFAAAIAVGVVYNNARIALEIRSRDLATMRILGFTRGELAGVLLGEQAIQVALGVVPGLFLGRWFGGLWLVTIDRELLRIPLVVSPTSYLAAACVVTLAALISALIVRRQSDHLDLVAVLKARD